jgi:hypothetical protein
MSDKNKIFEESKLITLIKNDEKLKENPDLRMGMIGMATMFLDNFSENMYKTSIEMNDFIPGYSIDAWRDFLNYPTVRKYIKSFKDERIAINVDESLGKGDKNAIGIKKAMEAGGPSINNSNIIIVRTPEKVDWDES